MPLPELQALDDVRIRQDWSWRELASDMKRRARVECSPRTLHYLVKIAPPTSRPLDRTLYKIQLYLRLVEKAQQKKRADAKRRARQKAATTAA